MTIVTARQMRVVQEAAKMVIPKIVTVDQKEHLELARVKLVSKHVLLESGALVLARLFLSQKLVMVLTTIVMAQSMRV